MKKIFLLSLVLLSIVAFTSCENDEIDVNEIKYATKVFPEPCTVWGCTVDSVKRHMSPYQFTYQDVYESNVTKSDGTIVQKWLSSFMGINPFSPAGKAIEYDYCYDESSQGLRAIAVYVGGDIQFSDLETQLSDGDYVQTGRDVKDKTYFYSNSKTDITVFYPGSNYVLLRYHKHGDDELTW